MVPIKRGDSVEVTEGLKKGARGTVRELLYVGDSGVRVWSVDLGERGIRSVREDYMRAMHEAMA